MMVAVHRRTVARRSRLTLHWRELLKLPAHLLDVQQARPPVQDPAICPDQVQPGLGEVVMSVEPVGGGLVDDVLVEVPQISTWMNSARFAYSCESFSTASVTGPQNRLMHYTGVANTARIGRCSASAFASSIDGAPGPGSSLAHCTRVDGSERQDRRPRSPRGITHFREATAGPTRSQGP